MFLAIDVRNPASVCGHVFTVCLLFRVCMSDEPPMRVSEFDEVRGIMLGRCPKVPRSTEARVRALSDPPSARPLNPPD